jgi:hypothetical protein
MNKFWLVQRLEETPQRRYDNPFGGDTNVAKTLDAQFRLDYMGSAEFEFGAVPQSANRIHQVANRLKVVTQNVVTPVFEEPVHFICTSEQEEETLPAWQEWVKAPHSLEDTYYFRSRDKWPYTDQDKLNYVGWWALEEDIIWTRDAGRAEGIRQAFVNLAQAHTT